MISTNQIARIIAELLGAILNIAINAFPNILCTFVQFQLLQNEEQFLPRDIMSLFDPLAEHFLTERIRPGVAGPVHPDKLSDTQSVTDEVPIWRKL